MEVVPVGGVHRKGCVVVVDIEYGVTAESVGSCLRRNVAVEM